jgi:hypothetical protein
MWRTLLTVSAGVVLLASGGCSSGPLLDNPALLRPDPTVTVENPVYLPLGPPAYNTVYEKLLDILDRYWEIGDENRYGGRIVTIPRTEPGLERSLVPGSPSCEERLYATLQSIRWYAVAQIEVANDGGFFVDVKVYKELEDVPRPTRATAPVAAFRSDNTVVERQREVIETVTPDSNWIPIGRDAKMEQAILQELKQCL